MKLNKIISIANKVYPDGLVGYAYEQIVSNPDVTATFRPSVGDGLAEFIARELVDTYDEKASSLEQIQEAHRIMSRAHTELGDVARTFSDLESELIPKGRKKNAK